VNTAERIQYDDKYFFKGVATKFDDSQTYIKKFDIIIIHNKSNSK